MNNKLIIISAVWCPSCLILKKHIKQIRKEFPNVEIETLDYDFDEEEVKKYDVGDKLPVIIYNNHIVIVKRKINALYYYVLEAFMNNNLFIKHINCIRSRNTKCR